MGVVKNEDCEGNSVTCVEYKGRYFPPRPDMEAKLNELESFNARPQDVWIVSFPKSGTHWCWDIVAMLQTGKLEHVKEVKENYMLEFNFMSDYDKLASPRVFNSHLLYTEMPQSIFKAKSKMIQVMRNPKDASVSFYHHFRGIANYDYNGSWKGFFDLIMRDKIEYGQWFDYVQNWWTHSRNNPEVLWLTYEDMIMDLPTNVRKIAEFLEIPSSDEYTAQVAEACTFAKMKAAKTEADLEYYPWREGFKHGMYRKGKVGNWREWFTVHQNDYFNKIFNERLEGFEDLKNLVKFELP